MGLKEKIRKYGMVIFGGIIISSGLAYGFAKNESELFRYFVLSSIVLSGGYLWLTRQQRVDERVLTLDKMLQEADANMVEMEDVIQHYGEMLNSVEVSFPCDCGQNVFEGIFVPNEAHYVECDKCKCKFRITMDLNSVLISEPLEDLNIDKLIKDNTEKYDTN